MSEAITSLAPPPDRNGLALANTEIVVGLANDYRGRGVPLDDLVAEGMIGLVEAAERFDRNRGTKFITYAAWWIRKRILKALAEQPKVVRLSGYQAKLERHGHVATPVVRPRIVPLDSGADDGARPVGERLRDPAASPEETILRDEAVDLIREEIARLNLPEQRVLALRFGLAGESGLTLQEAGERLNVSRERVRQIEACAIERLRHALSSRHRRMSPPSLGSLRGAQGS